MCYRILHVRRTHTRSRRSPPRPAVPTADVHGAGIAGAPKFGDKAAWAPRLATGIDTLYKVALTGKGAMPPRGGNKDLSDAEVKAAVDTMVAAGK